MIKRIKTPQKILKKIAENGAMIIKNNMKIFTHCYSKTVIEILKIAKSKKIQVFVSETRPKLLGRKTTKILAKNNIPVTIFPDSIGRTVLEKCDILLLGCETFFEDKSALNKIGSLALAEKAYEKNIPVYICTSTSKKMIKKIPTKKFETDKNQIWKNAPKNIQIRSPTYEYIPGHLITNYITET